MKDLFYKIVIRTFYLPLAIIFLISGCAGHRPGDGSESLLVTSPEPIKGHKNYLSTPYVTAGDRVYMIGNQDGSFPDLGWHIEGEMGGIWDHPVKLMDGFSVAVNGHCLDRAYQFLNYPMANTLFYAIDSLRVERFQFVPDSMEAVVIRFKIINDAEQHRDVKFNFTGMTDLLPVWLSDSLGIINGGDMALYDDSLGCIVARDSLNPWYVIFGSGYHKPDRYIIPAESCKQIHKGSGIDATLEYRLAIKAHDSVTLNFIIAGSYNGRQHAVDQFELVREKADDMLRRKIRRFGEIGRRAEVELPDTSIARMYTWLKYNIQWLYRNVPGTGEGLSAGLPDYPWWFGCDNTYALQGVLCAGETEVARRTIILLHDLSEKINGNGRITHEVSTNGVAYNRGNLNETPHFIMLLWTYFQWTGDIELIRKYYPFIIKGFQWLESTDKDGNLCPDGSGMMEIEGLNSEMIDVASYTCGAYQAASEIARVLNDTVRMKLYQENALKLRNIINDQWWVGESNSFADFRSEKGKAIEVIRSATRRAENLGKPWAVNELKALLPQVEKNNTKEVQGYVVYHNWVVNTPMETGIADPSKAVKALETAAKFTDPFGLYVTGIDRDENLQHANIDSMRKKVFSYTGAVMPLPTGVQAVAEARFGRIDHSLAYIKKLSNSFSYALPGSLYEVSPDFGMMTQAWNIYGVEVPVVRYFFGVTPDAYHHKIIVKPSLPSSWDHATISKLPVGDNFITIEIDRSEAGTIYKFDQEKENWKIILELHPQDGTSLSVNDRVQQLSGKDNIVHIQLTGNKNRVWLKE